MELVFDVNKDELEGEISVGVPGLGIHTDSNSLDNVRARDKVLTA